MLRMRRDGHRQAPRGGRPGRQTVLTTVLAIDCHSTLPENGLELRGRARGGWAELIQAYQQLHAWLTYIDYSAVDLVKHLLVHGLRKVHARDLGSKRRGELSELDVSVSGNGSVRHVVIAVLSAAAQMATVTGKDLSGCGT